jgi:superfamily II DNA or RNA helicase
MSKPQIVGDVVKTWLEKAERRPTLVFGVDCAHGKHLQACFEQAGVRCGYQDAHTSVADRAEIRRQFHTGHLEVVCNIGTLTTGVDWDVRCISLVRPTKSEILYVQIIGRGLRTAKGKDYCLILDHSSTTSKLGFVTDIHHTALDDGKATVEERQAPQPKECPQCHGLRPAGVRTCPHCGFVAPAEAKPNNVEHRAGELVEFSRHDGGSLKQSGNRIKVGQTDISRADLYGMLRHYAEAHGYAQGWAAQKYRQATGHWPSAETKFAVMKAPCWELSNWIRSRQIAYAKMRAKSEGRTWR